MTYSFQHHIKLIKFLSCFLGLAAALGILLQVVYYSHAASPFSFSTQALLGEAKSSSSFYSANWAGYEATGKAAKKNSTGTFQRAEGTFTIPRLSSNNPQDMPVVLWVGIGGGNPQIDNQVLVQAGIITEIDSQGDQITAAWYEVFTTSGYSSFNTVFFNFSDKSLLPGHSIYVDVNSKLENNGQKYSDYFFVGDENTGESQKTSLTGSFQAGGLSDGASAECIVERPADDNGDVHKLPNFGIAHFTDCRASANDNSSDAQQPIGSFGHTQKITMVNDNNGTLAAPGSLSSKQNFDVTWKNYN